MRWISIILILTFIYLLCTSDGCTENAESIARREEQAAMTLRGNIRDIFTTDSITDEFLRAYELTAIHKLIDFSDFLNVVFDTTLEIRFRRHSLEVIKDLFISENIELPDLSRTNTKPSVLTLKYLLSKWISIKVSDRIETNQIEVSEKFKQENDSTFSGKLTFYNKHISLNKITFTQICSERFEIDIYLIKIPKIFGDERYNVWQVFLGDINQNL